MTINIEELQSMWERDSKIDPDNLHLESLKIPGLHSKYYNLYNTLKLLNEKAHTEFSSVKLEEYLKTLFDLYITFYFCCSSFILEISFWSKSLNEPEILVRSRLNFPKTNFSFPLI